MDELRDWTQKPDGLQPNYLQPRKMKIEIVTPDTTIYEGEVSLAQLPGLDGSFEVLNNHAPMIAALKKGKVKVIDAKKATLFFEINGGVMEILKNRILVLAE